MNITRSKHLFLLSQFRTIGSPLFTDESDSREDIDAWLSMGASDLIDGTPDVDETGRVVAIANMTITAAGEAYLEELIAAQKLGTVCGFLAAHRWKVYFWTLSTVGGAAMAWLIKRSIGE